MIDYPWLDGYLKQLLVDSGGDMWDADTRANAVYEAVLATVRLRPEIYSEVIKIEINTDLYSFSLPDEYEGILKVHGVIEEGEGTRVIKSLKNKPEAEILTENACWRATGGPADSYVYSPDDPYNLYLVGIAPLGSELECLVAKAPQLVTSSTTEIPLRASFIPEIVNYALTRLYNRLDSPSGKEQGAFSMFRTGAVDKLNTDIAKNAAASAESQ